MPTCTAVDLHLIFLIKYTMFVINKKYHQTAAALLILSPIIEIRAVFSDSENSKSPPVLDQSGCKASTWRGYDG